MGRCKMLQSIKPSLYYNCKIRRRGIRLPVFAPCIAVNCTALLGTNNNLLIDRQEQQPLSATNLTHV